MGDYWPLRSKEFVVADARAVQVVVGSGPLGLAVSRELRHTGEPCRLVSRGGRTDGSAGTEIVVADVSDAADARRAFEGASVVYQCAAPRYSQWPALMPALMRGVIEGASAVGARLVYGDNLYAYGRVSGPLTEDLPYKPLSPNTRTRAEVAEALMKADADGKVRATIGRGSDFFGPHAMNSSVGVRVFGRLLRGKPAQVLGNPDVPHTVTFIDDFARALITLGSRDESLGDVWHVPSAETVPVRRFVQLIAEQAGGPAKMQPMPSWMLAIIGLFKPDVRAVREVLYQSEEPWVVDHSKFERAFGADPTPHPEAIKATLDWFRTQQAG
jgi:nucleoside-diphosphate-sugar epimerase